MFLPQLWFSKESICNLLISVQKTGRRNTILLDLLNQEMGWTTQLLLLYSDSGPCFAVVIIINDDCYYFDVDSEEAAGYAD